MKHKNTGFTLVEILIVVIILGILAAIVIPQFTEASNDARVSALVSDLQTVRSQVELYKVQHKDDYPGTVSGTWTIGNFVTHLTSKTTIDGVAGGTLGPYLQKFPTNPFNTSAAVRDATAVADPNSEVSTEGWWFNSTTGNFGVNSTDYIDR
ncbi:MAG TPA: prepilin-type N-terminal cleavage/methylation domain-containing protein [Phycisphaerae bacterium]|nr:prepilin-type N-terminal cleavage/methylation domain-containing protein [Phycisphaerae bacterium]